MKEKENETGCTSQKVLRISLQQIVLLVDETKKVFPIEACGLLFGRVGEEIVIEKIVPTPNILNSSYEFEINDEIVGAALNEIEPIRGFFHSHPALPVPSARDLKYMKLWGKNYVWLILSTIKYGGIGAYMIDKNGQPERVTIYIYKEP